MPQKYNIMKKYYFTLSVLLVLAFTTGDSKSEYILPLRASSVYSADIDLDGDMDIVVGHNYSSITDWTGITVMINNGDGYFSVDSLYLNGQHRRVLIGKINNNEEQDLITQCYDGNSSQIGVLFDFVENQNNLLSIDIVNYADRMETGDINGDGYTDIVFAFGVEQQWGVIYNDGTGNFSEPEYYDTELYPNNIAVGDIDGNGRDDIALAGSNTEIWYSFENGFETFYFTGAEHDIDLKDMDNDGDMDVITLWGAFSTTVVVYENLGYQNFQSHYVCMLPTTSGGLRTSDLNNDSYADISFSAGGNFKYLTNKGNMTFTGPDSIVIPGFAYGIHIWRDLDKNTYPDIIVTKLLGIYAPNLKILFNDGEGNFGENPMVSNPSKKAISQNSIHCYPNPFSIKTNIAVHTVENNAEVVLYNLSGKEVKQLTQSVINEGSGNFVWDGTNDAGEICKAGTYLLVLKVNGSVLQTAKLIKY